MTLEQLDQDSVALRFQEFLEQARPLLEPSSAPIVEPFRVFSRKAKRIVTEHLRGQLPDIEEHCRSLQRWINPHDLFAIAGYSFLEVPYTKLISWALSPEAHEESALTRQQGWLISLGIVAAEGISSAAEPLSEFITDDGIADLVLRYENLLVVIEAKTGSTEGLAPLSRKYQTIAYPSAVRRRLDLPSDFPTWTVFLTSDGHRPKNPKAIATTYAQFVFAITAILDYDILPEETRQALSLVFSHFLRHATPEGVNLVELIQAFFSGPVGSGPDPNGQMSGLLQRSRELSFLAYCMNREG